MANGESTPNRKLFTETALWRFLALRLAGATHLLEDVAAGAGFDTSDRLMSIARGETSITFKEMPKLAALLGVNTGFIAGLLIAEHREDDLLDVLAAVLPAGSSIGNASIESTDNDKQKTQAFEFAVRPAVSFDFESLIADTGECMNLNFKVPPAFHRRFRFEAAMADISMKRLTEICSEMYLDDQANK